MKDFTRIMKKRWQASNRDLPRVDRRDIQREVPLVNGGKTVSLTDRRQHGAEYTQSSYLGML